LFHFLPPQNSVDLLHFKIRVLTVSFAEWSWVHGSNSLRQPGKPKLFFSLIFFLVASFLLWLLFASFCSGVYGEKGTGTASTVPGARSASCTWTDSDGHFWLFGGYGVDGDSTTSKSSF
jgi:hypothetical protein